MRDLKPKIYVACLAAYNSGYLHGAWIDATKDVDSLYIEIREILANSPIPNAEEWAIHDYEDFGDAFLSEYTEIEKVCELATLIVEQGELGLEVLSHFCGDINDASRSLEECYHGEFSSEEDFVYYWIYEVECRIIPEYLQPYINYKAMARDFFMSDFFSVKIDHKVHVFSNH